MFHTPDYYNNISLRLSEVLDDIGVNEHMVLKTRRAALLGGTMSSIMSREFGDNTNITIYCFGSLSEGTTTIGLKPDSDILLTLDDMNVTQALSGWIPGKFNYLMIQNETIPPGYCLLQTLRDDVPLPFTHGESNIYARDTSGRILCKNCYIDNVFKGSHRQGPASAFPEEHGYTARDIVIALPCKSWPKSQKVWLNQQEMNTWPTSEMKRYMRSSKCFVVGVGNKVSENEAFEWRFSTSLAERCLMFNLNITQLRCYILMKMIIKTYINIDNESDISSYMCKTVLFHCIASKHSHIWKGCNVFKCLSFCLFTLSRCIIAKNCPHFIVHENNLMAGKMSTEVQKKMLERISNLIPCDIISISRIEFDKLGERFQSKLNMTNEVHVYRNIPQSDDYKTCATGDLTKNIARITLGLCRPLIETKKGQCLGMKLFNLLKIVKHLTRYHRENGPLEKAACRLISPLLCTAIGSLIASRNIEIDNTVSPQAHAWLDAGLHSDVASGKLKLASIMHCAGDIVRTAVFLHDIEVKYRTDITEAICRCYTFPIVYGKQGLGQLCCQFDAAEAVKYTIAFCVCFSANEINCVPHELRYEMFRSTQEDLLHREDDDVWMDSAVIDSLPFLCFLQYKTYAYLKRPEAQQPALAKLVWAIETELNLGHRETALNMLGQCMEQENRHADALQFYLKSLRIRERNNAAKIHICRCLAGIISQRQTTR